MTMNARHKLCAWIFLGMGLWLTGCNQHDSDKGAPDNRFEMGAAGGESDDSGYLGLRIINVHESQNLLDHAPWFASGGDWTFIECEGAKDAAVRVLIGSKESAVKTKDTPLSWGESVITVTDARAGAKFVEAFAKAFHQAIPDSRGEKPALILKAHTAVLGAALVRDAHGGFSDRHGSWVATKWFLQDDNGETELFFNYSAKEHRAEFSEKDEDYREDLIRQFAVGLRDGPLPERTFENDPSLTKIGPTVGGWVKVANSNETCRFVSDSKTLEIIANKEEGGSQLFSAPVSDPGTRTLLGDFAGSIYVEQRLPASQGTTLLLIERLHPDKKMFSSADPQKLWLLDSKGKHEVIAPSAITNWFVAKGGLSPDGRFLALGSWRTEPDKKRSRLIHLLELQTSQWHEITMPGTILELTGWIDGGRKGLVLTGLGANTNEVREAYSLEPGTGQLTALTTLPVEFETKRMFSPNHKFSAEVIGKERIVIKDSAGAERQFIFHPYDRHNVSPNSVHWVSDRYLVFESGRTSLIDINSLKMNYPSPKETGIDAVEFSPDFTTAIGSKADGHYLAHVILAESHGN